MTPAEDGHAMAAEAESGRKIGVEDIRIEEKEMVTIGDNSLVVIVRLFYIILY